MPYARVNAEKYREAHRRAARLYQKRHRRCGLCIKCPRRAVGDTIYCRVHRRYKGLRRRWSPAEDSILRAAWLKKVPIRKIAVTLRRPERSVQARGKLLGLPSRNIRTSHVRSTLKGAMRLVAVPRMTPGQARPQPDWRSQEVSSKFKS